MHFSFLVFGQFLHSDLLVLVCAFVGVWGALYACIVHIEMSPHTHIHIYVCMRKTNKLWKKLLENVARNSSKIAYFF